jgi:DNA-binding transcriptional regulator YiaG
MLKILPKSPRKEHWEALKYLPEDELMSPHEFLDRWDVSYRELAAITHQSIDSVKNWFSRGIAPRYEAKRRLAIVHRAWIQMDQFR